jgi:hypothetical protein
MTTVDTITHVRVAMEELHYEHEHLSAEEIELALATVSEDTPSARLRDRSAIAGAALCARKFRGQLAMNSVGRDSAEITEPPRPRW